MYEKKDVEAMLRNYLISKSQLEELESKIEKNNVLIEYNGKKYTESEKEAIEGMVFKIPVLTDMPKGKTNKINNQTEKIALTYKKELSYINEADKVALMNENVINEAKVEPLKNLVEKVNRMLRALNNEQKLIIKSYYMNEPKWNYVANIYFEVYKETRTINQLKNIRNIALDIMLKVINI